MVGGYLGLGFTFEKILFASLILPGDTEDHNEPLVFKESQSHRGKNLYQGMHEVKGFTLTKI